MKYHSLPLTAALPEFGLRLPIHWIKELRVTFPVALGAGLCILLSIISDFSHGLATFLIYPATCSAIVSLAFGHDFTYRTLTSALALPLSRQKLFWTRLALCAGLLGFLFTVTIAAANFPILVGMQSGRVEFDNWKLGLSELARYLAVPPLAALCLAPWLTMVSRNTIFGTVISFSAPYVVGFGSSIFGKAGPVMWAPLSAMPLQLLLIIAAILSYRRFMTLEAIDSDVSIRSKRKSRGPVNTDQQTQIASAGLQIRDPADPRPKHFPQAVL